jgi:hypothetical protein
VGDQYPHGCAAAVQPAEVLRKPARGAGLPDPHDAASDRPHRGHRDGAGSRRGGHRAGVRAGSAPLVSACAAAAAAPRGHYLPFLDAAGASDRPGTGAAFPGAPFIHRRRRAGAAGPWRAVVLQMLLARCLQAGQALGLRLAQPGEFTQRAFLNDKMDLAQAEAVADLIDASTETAARSATRSLSGANFPPDPGAAAALTELRMLIEATLDFPEEEIDILRRADVQGRLTRCRTRCQDPAQRAPGRIAARGHQGRDRRPAQRRQVVAAQCAGGCRAGDRVAGCRNHPRQDPADDPDRRGAAACDRHRRVCATAATRSNRWAWRGPGARSTPPTRCLFLHDLTRLVPSDNGPAAQDASCPAYQRADAAIAAEPGAASAGRRCR